MSQHFSDIDYFSLRYINKIKSLNSSYIQPKKLERLKYIYRNSKVNFALNLKRYKNKKIKYVILGEAPPWSEEGYPRYFYSKIESKLHETFWNTFYSEPIPKDMNYAYNMLAQKQFLLIDSIPYAMNYSPRLRRKEIYNEIIYEFLSNELIKINDKIAFNDDLKIAFAFRLNGMAIIKAFNGSIKIGNNVSYLCETNIAADGTGFPKKNKLKHIFELEDK